MVVEEEGDGVVVVVVVRCDVACVTMSSSIRGLLPESLINARNSALLRRACTGKQVQARSRCKHGVSASIE